MKLIVSVIAVAKTTWATTGVSPSVTSDCTRLGTCLESPTVVTNAAMSTGGGIGVNIGLPSLTGTSPMSMTINDCANILIDQLTAVQGIQSLNSQIWTDVSTTQGAMTGVEASVQDLLNKESGFATELGQVAQLIHNTTDRASNLTSWLSGQKVIRSQLTSLYTRLDTRVRENSNKILVTTSSVRDALSKMQLVHDHATKILEAVGDAETEMYEWAANVTQKVNAHTVTLVGIAQTLQYRRNQLAAVKDSNVNLNWIATKLSEKYGEAKLASLSQAYDAGETVDLASKAMPSIQSTSITTESTDNQVDSP
jgi:hypothetical protein